VHQYIYKDIFKGKARELLIIGKEDSSEYRIFCDGSLLGILLKDTESQPEPKWTTVYNILKPVAGRIGQFIDNH
jgi:hypothetical protein